MRDVWVVDEEVLLQFPVLVHVVVKENPYAPEFRDIAACDLVGGTFVSMDGVGIIELLETFGQIVAAEKADVGELYFLVSHQSVIGAVIEERGGGRVHFVLDTAVVREDGPGEGEHGGEPELLGQGFGATRAVAQLVVGLQRGDGPGTASHRDDVLRVDGELRRFQHILQDVVHTRQQVLRRPVDGIVELFDARDDGGVASPLQSQSVVGDEEHVAVVHSPPHDRIHLYGVVTRSRHKSAAEQKDEASVMLVLHGWHIYVHFEGTGVPNDVIDGRFLLRCQRKRQYDQEESG